VQLGIGSSADRQLGRFTALQALRIRDRQWLAWDHRQGASASEGICSGSAVGPERAPEGLGDLVPSVAAPSEAASSGADVQ